MTTPDDPYAGQPAPSHGSAPAQPAAQPPQQPAYYGQVPYYGPPVPNPPNRGVWFAIGAASMFGFLIFAVGGFFSIVGFLLGDDFEGSSDDGYYYVDQTSVIEAVEGPCANLRYSASNIDVFSTPKDASEDIKAFTLAIKGVVEAIDASDPNSDSRRWRDDWKVLSAELDTYSDDLVAAGAPAKFRPLTEDKQPLVDRMSYSSDADCEVPAVIEALDPKMTLDGDFVY